MLDLARARAGVVSRPQALEQGLTLGQIKAILRRRQWQSHLPGVYATFTGPVAPRARVWAALLYAGAGATASHGTAAWLWGLRKDFPARIDVCVPFGRRVDNQPGLRVSSRRNLEAVRHPVLLPPRTRVEDPVLDLAEQAVQADEVVALLTGACQRRLTSAARLGGYASRRRRLRWRGLVADVLGDVQVGVQSPLERHYRVLERAHGLPTGERNRAEGPPGLRTYRDVRYRKFATVVELDGNAAHPIEDRELDRIRDNAVAEAAQVTLRYGWKSVVGAPCAVAAQVGRVLAGRGWNGTVRHCGPGCSA